MPRRPLLIRRAGLPAGGVVAALLLGACSGPVAVETGEDGASDACAQVVAGLPASLGGAPRRETSGGPGTAAWGDPAILLRCGVEPPGATTLPCVGVPGTAEDVDWIVLATGESGSIVRTYGRDPAVEVEVPATYGPAPVSVLPELSDAVSAVPATSVCVG